VSPCRAPLVVCAAPDRIALQALKRAAVGAAWELSDGATSADDALQQLQDHHALALVVQEPVPGLVERAREEFPGLRIVAIAGEPVEGASTVVGSLEAIRGAILGVD
jgi:hypothetical protein